MSKIRKQYNNFSNAKIKSKGTAINNDGAKIKKQTNWFIFKNDEIDKIKKDFFDVRLKLNPLICKILLIFNSVLLIASVIGFKLLQTDSFYTLFTSSLIALILSVIYYIFNKAYYKEYKMKNDEISKSDKFTVLLMIDILMFGSLFWIYTADF